MLYDDCIALDDATLFEQIVLRRRSNGDKAYQNFDQWFDHAQRGHGQMREWQAVLSSDEFRASAVALAQQPTQAAFVDVMHTMSSLPKDFPINQTWEELCKHIPGVHIGTPPGDVSMILYVTMESAKEMLSRHSPMSPMTVREVLVCVLVLVVRIARASGLDNAYKQIMNEAEDDEEEAKQDDEDRDDNDVDKEGVEEDEDEEHVDGGTNGGDERSTLDATMAELRVEIISLRRRLGTLEPKRSRSQPKRSRSRSRSRSQSRSRPLEFMRSE